MRSEAVSIAPQTVLPITKYFGPEIFLKPQKNVAVSLLQEADHLEATTNTHHSQIRRPPI